MGLEGIHVGDALEVLRTFPEGVVQCCITSPPYWGLRDYGIAGQIGREADPSLYIDHLVEVFREVRRVLRDDGVLWLNLGDTYATAGGDHGGRVDNQPGVGARRVFEADAGDKSVRRPPPGLKAKDLVGIPWRVALCLRDDGWWLRSEIIWHKPTAMPESVSDRPTRAHEQVFLLAKSASYYYDANAIRESAVGTDGRRNVRSVWTIQAEPCSEAHFAVFPSALVSRCLLAGSRPGDLVLDPFFGSGTVGRVAEACGRRWCGIELKPEYIEIARKRTSQLGLFRSEKEKVGGQDD
jgi:DNA modification methylase